MLIIRNFDYLSTEAYLVFNHQGESRYKTFFGGLMSLLSIIVSFGFIVVYSVDFVNKENVSVRVSSENSNNLKFPLMNSIPFLFRLTNSSNYAYEFPEKIYKVHLVYWTGVIRPNSSSQLLTYQEIPVEKCNINKHFGDYGYLYKSLIELDTYFCPIIRNPNQTVHGVFGSSESYGYYQFFLSYCDNKTYQGENDEDKCYDISFIEDKLEYTYLDFRFIDFGINNVYSNDIKSASVRAETFSFSRTMYKRIWMFVNKVIYIKDTGIIFKILKEEDFYQFHSLRFDRDARDISDGIFENTFGSLSIMGVSRTTVYHQRRMKIQEVIANISGITKFVYMCCFIVNYYYSYNSYSFRMINEMLSVMKDNSSGQKNQEIIKGPNLFLSQSLEVKKNNSNNNNPKLIKVNTQTNANVFIKKRCVNKTKSDEKEKEKSEGNTNTINNSEVHVLGINQSLKLKKSENNNQLDWSFIDKLFPIGCCFVKKKKVIIFKQLFKETNRRFSITTIFKLNFYFDKNRKSSMINLGEKLLHSITPLESLKCNT